MFGLVCSAWFVLSVLAGSTTSHCTVTFPENKKGVGIYNVTFNNVHYCEYLGVRYATSARFRDPVLYKPKNHEQYNREGSICPQMNELSYADAINGDEDCLFLNIYGPQYDSKKAGFGGFPVLVFIHGGSFQLGSASFEFSGADLLVEKETIVISVNYRLNVLGFLHYPPYNITGNYGLKDQQAAMMWINQYVKFFGGDPNRVTLMGQSAGAAAVSYHLYSDRSRGLFQQAALLSGSFLAPWAYTYRPEYFAEQYFKATGITSLQQLYDRNASDLIMLNDWIGSYYFSRFITWTLPTSEADDDPNPFFTASPQEMSIRKRALDVPLLVGKTLLEYETAMLYHSTPTQRINVPNRWSQKVWDKLISYIDVNVQQFKEKGLIANQREFTIKASNNFNLNFPLEHSIDQLVAKGHTAPIFLYRFDFDGKFGMYKNDVIKSQLIDTRYGAVHGDDLGYIFNPYILREALNRKKNYQKEWKVHDRMSEVVANFVKFGFI
ncbi:juvenile hormone esterase [Culex quinquefasciatus]|uniref:Carboxylic ester hydrolase n=1 Tax=Culex quinquefasciatus TaxID=7176 RepID=B0XEK9_CULQU|nr:juvenile hormone esterase [Culex quinquefasciatus]|eukprot:XP_001868081.1 juvenile hormone esterase [Culex quinquefasciatus]